MVWSWSPSGQAQLFTHLCGLLFIQDIHGPVQQHNVIDSSESLAPGCQCPTHLGPQDLWRSLLREPTSWLLLPLPISYLIFCFSTFEPQVLYPNGGEGDAGRDGSAAENIGQCSREEQWARRIQGGQSSYPEDLHLLDEGPRRHDGLSSSWWLPEAEKEGNG